jgi:2-methylcitrate dehydratase PrpD
MSRNAPAEMPQPSASLTGLLAGYWSGTTLSQLPAEVVVAAKRALLDTIAVAIAGAETEVADAARRGLASSAGGSASVWGTADCLSAPLAALVNGIAAHALELDDFSGAGHVGASVIPTLVAIADTHPVTGPDALVAIAAGYDVADRVNEGLGGYRALNDRGWHSTGVCGTLGCAAAAARALNLDSTRFRDAIGVGGTYTGGTWAFLVDGSMTKRYHTGKAAEGGVLAGLLAAAGFDGPAFVLEAPWGGVLATFAAEGARPEAVIDGLGSDFKILDDGIKPYACCRGSHGAVEALLGLVTEGGVNADEIDRIVYHGSAQTVRQLSGRRLRTTLDGQFSLPYTLALASVHRRVTLDLFRPLQLDDPSVMALMDRVEMIGDRPVGEKGEGDVEVHTGGKVLTRRIRIPLGDPRNMLSESDLLDKARSLIEPVLGRSRFDEIAALIGGLEDVADFREIGARLAR